MKITASQFEALFFTSTPLIDVRAPIEFNAGSIPGAVNLPLLTNEERHKVGLTYKQNGQEAAIELGHQLVNGSVKESRVRAWCEELEKHPQAIIYCFRGGLRSQLVQSWLREQGVERPIVEGGYKALRQFLMGVFESQVQSMEFEVVSGLTGSGKTTYLHSSGRPHLDLEGIAVHRGSAFGAMEWPQPNQVDFENALAVELLRLSTLKGKILVEDESRSIGHRLIPDGLFNKMKSSPKVWIECSLEDRVENIFADYILNSSLGLRRDIQKFEDFRKSITGISRKLGGVRAQEILQDLNFSQQEFKAGRGLDSNRVWIRKLLQWYYDPFYQKAQPEKD